MARNKANPGDKNIAPPPKNRREARDAAKSEAKLSGASDKYKCPECGAAYDSQTMLQLHQLGH